MVWAAVLAVAFTWAFLLLLGGIVRRAGHPWLPFAIPPSVLSLGALDWTLFSGMENAMHLAVTGLLIAAVLRQVSPPPNRPPSRAHRPAIALLASLALLTRPESLALIVASAVFAFVFLSRSLKARSVLAAWLIVPSVLTLVLQSVMNRVFTGEWSANGALVKLALYNPYLSAAETWNEYKFHLDYIIDRITKHHLAPLDAHPSRIPWGWIVPSLAVLPLAAGSTRRLALLLWAWIIAWFVVIPLNGQVRWQNERYVMPAVAWLLVLGGLGLGLLLRAGQSRRRLIRAPALLLAAVAAGGYIDHQADNMRDQLWFFARACRNILDQHLTAGEVLKQIRPKRVLVGDAGAMIYASDRPGLDLIGLGGYHRYPFARASVHGLGASLELIERMPPNERPDVMALYPTWWADLPIQFGKPIAEFPVFGNVICGGRDKVLYLADWSSMRRDSKPLSLNAGEAVVDEVDVADLVSERAHRYVFPHPSNGFVDYRILPSGGDRRRDLFDAGRWIRSGSSEQMEFQAPKATARIVVRSAPVARARIEVRVDGQYTGVLELERREGWTEGSTSIPAPKGSRMTVELAALDDDWFNAHVWLVTEDSAALPQAR